MPKVLSLNGLFLLVGLVAATEPHLTTSDTAIAVDLGNGTTLTFARHGDLLLGLREATVDATALTSADTVLRPLVAQEFAKDRIIAPFLKLRQASVVAGRVELVCDLLGTDDEIAYRDVFVFTGDRKAALAALPDDLARQKAKKDVAQARLDELLETTEPLQKLRAKEAACRAKLAGDEASKEAKRRAEDWLKKLAKRRLPDARGQALPGLLEANAEAKQAKDTIDAFKTALDAYAVIEHGKIFRDFYRFAHLRQPAEVCRVETVTAAADRLAGSLKPVGTLTWVVEPATDIIAGWPWQGWTQSFRIALADGRKINNLRLLGTWELDGSAVGTTVVALRYRGLGKIAQQFTDDGQGAVEEAWSTTEIIPGAAGGGHAVSPVIPPSTGVNDRGYALTHRLGAWISKPARGGGAPFVDFQFKPCAAFCSFNLRQADLRALSECHPGDSVISQTDEEFFALTDERTTEPRRYLALVHPQDVPLNEWRTRWQEVDQHVRDLISEELGFVQFEPLPGVGTIASGQPVNLMKQYSDQLLAQWAASGMRMVASHSPGWINGEIFYDGKLQDSHKNGGECSIYDWLPPPNMYEPWQTGMRNFAKHGIAYLPWIGQTIVAEGPFVQRVGTERAHWSLNTPFDQYGPGYAPMHVKGNVHNPAFRDEFLRCVEKTAAEYGLQGFWIDSFQNLMMSQLAWSDGSGAPMQRAWFEILADWSRKGRAIMAESHAFPGMSCSIEVHGWEDEFWYFQHVWKWLRGLSQSRYEPARLNDMTYRFMACKAWIAAGYGYGLKADFGIPQYGRMANEYLAALPGMRRSYCLPDDRGMLWLPYDGDDTGVLFPFTDMPLPEGVTASPILGEEAAAELKAEHTYRVSGTSPATAFGMQAPPAADPRLGRTYTMPTHTWPDWATSE